ncbi:hypothetical protein K2Z83_11230 [Oscillochloris sp. ZM17-4]|uniref:hypothetical protein n=1 Tax=Oscillochloris sp. ZM17-4 TaxID=2866714 RepID=UPI001C72BB6E|nr:hypothetical protein [Oscillochloris sp. ZM17-4]MBX0328249.1 hypothetical protein [Oscillochloris sp. ZM17-4]
MPYRSLHMTGGVAAHRAHLAMLSTPPKKPHRPTPMPPPTAAGLRANATSLRREADSLEHDLDGPAPALRKQVADLRALADDLEAQALALE